MVYQALNLRIEASRLHEGPIPGISLETVRQLVTRFGSNLRAIEGHLYEQAQTQVTQHGEVRLVG